jgi:hypothetical protein
MAISIAAIGKITTVKVLFFGRDPGEAPGKLHRKSPAWRGSLLTYIFNTKLKLAYLKTL